MSVTNLTVCTFRELARRVGIIESVSGRFPESFAKPSYGGVGVPTSSTGTGVVSAAVGVTVASLVSVCVGWASSALTGVISGAVGVTVAPLVGVAVGWGVSGVATAVLDAIVGVAVAVKRAMSVCVIREVVVIVGVASGSAAPGAAAVGVAVGSCPASLSPVPGGPLLGIPSRAARFASITSGLDATKPARSIRVLMVSR